MLKQRIITACLLLPWVIAAVLFLPSPYFAGISGFIFLCGIWEWTSLAGFSSLLSRLGSMFLFPLITLLLMIILHRLGRAVLEEGLFLFIAAFWLFVLYGLYRYPKNLLFSKSPSIGLISGAIALIPAWFLLVALQYKDPRYALYILVLVWVADSSAYFIGKRFGTHKLALAISPGKTWEGALGACIVSIFVIGIAYTILKPNTSFLSWQVLGLLAVIFSIIGDLFESAYKRVRNLKDSGRLLPGHGGVLDRIDSLTAAIPIFTIGFMFLN